MARILVVEDEAHLAEGLQFNLEAEGHEVVVAADGPAALERLLAAGGGFDLVLLDLMLPGLSGFEVLRRARAAGVLVPVLVLTAKDETPDLVRGLEEGADDYLTKPFHLDELLARVRGLLRRRRWDGAAEPAAPRAARRSASRRCTSTASSSRRRRGRSASRRASSGCCARSPSARARR